MEKLITAREICKMFCITDVTLANWMRAGWFPQPLRVGTRKRLWRVEDIEAVYNKRYGVKTEKEDDLVFEDEGDTTSAGFDADKWAEENRGVLDEIARKLPIPMHNPYEEIRMVREDGSGDYNLGSYWYGHLLGCDSKHRIFDTIHFVSLHIGAPTLHNYVEKVTDRKGQLDVLFHQGTEMDKTAVVIFALFRIGWSMHQEFSDQLTFSNEDYDFAECNLHDQMMMVHGMRAVCTQEARENFPFFNGVPNGAGTARRAKTQIAPERKSVFDDDCF